MLSDGKTMIVLFGAVYDFTQFQHVHPGGKDIIVEFRGKDATEKFVEVGHLKGANIIKTLSSFRVGRYELADKPKM